MKIVFSVLFGFGGIALLLLEGVSPIGIMGVALIVASGILFVR